MILTGQNVKIMVNKAIVNIRLRPAASVCRVTSSILAIHVTYALPLYENNVIHKTGSI